MAVERVDGVENAEFSYEERTGIVTYDPKVTSPEEFLTRLDEMTGFKGTVESSSDETP